LPTSLDGISDDQIIPKKPVLNTGFFLRFFGRLSNFRFLFIFVLLFKLAMFSKIPTPFKNFYFIVAGVFLIWMLLLDANNLFRRYQLSAKLNSLENEKEYYQEKIVQVEKDHNELFGDPSLVEKFAREKYLMKKPTETIFIIEEE
jgi:cell division protein DivIC